MKSNIIGIFVYTILKHVISYCLQNNIFLDNILYFRYGYAAQNEFKLHNAIMKYDFKDQTQTIKYELSDGEFATEPIFVGDGGENEDDGYVLVQTINTRAKKASIVILNAKDMKPEFIGLAPELGLFGLHSSFFPFDIGCSTDDCTPK